MPPIRGVDNEKKAFRGQPLAIPAATFNGLVDALRRHKRERYRQGPGGPDTSAISPADTILVRNTLGDLTRSWQVVKIGSPLLTAEGDDGENLADRLAFDGGLPTSDGAVAILQGPCPADEIVTAAVSGITPAYVRLVEAGHRWANPVGGVTGYLESSADPGYARILWTGDGGTPPTDPPGCKLAVVLLTGDACPPAERVACVLGSLVREVSYDCRQTWQVEEDLCIPCGHCGSGSGGLIESPCCPGVALPPSACLTFHDPMFAGSPGGAYSFLDGVSLTLNYATVVGTGGGFSGTGWWSGGYVIPEYPPDPQGILLLCDGVSWHLGNMYGVPYGGGTRVLFHASTVSASSCSPLVITGTIGDGGTPPATISFTITAGACSGGGGGGIVLDCCPGKTIPATLTAQTLNPEDCACPSVSGNMPIYYLGDGLWAGSTESSCDGGIATFRLSCDGGTWYARYTNSAGVDSGWVEASSVDCSGSELLFVLNMGACGPTSQWRVFLDR